MKTILLSLITLSLFSCKPKVEESSSLAGGGGLAGTWNKKVTCKSSSAGSYSKTKLVYAQTTSTFEETSNVYSDSTCSTPILTLAVKGNYTTSNATSDLFEDQMDLDSTLISLLVTPNSAAIVTDYNTVVYCGFNNWQLNISKDVAGLTCSGSVMPSSGTVQFTFYTISKVSSTGPIAPSDVGDLNFGTTSSGRDGTSISQRHTTTLISPYVRE